MATLTTQKRFEKTCVNCGPQIWADPTFKTECSQCDSPTKQRIQRSIEQTKFDEECASLRADLKAFRESMKAPVESASLDRAEKNIKALKNCQFTGL